MIRTGEVWELSAFRAEAMSAREQTAAFSSAVDDLKKRLTSMKEVNQRLRVMLGIENPKTGDVVNGRGGEDVPLPDGNTLPASEKSSKNDTVAQHFSSVESSQSALTGQTSASAGSSGLTEQESDRFNQGWYRLAVERSCDPGTIASRVVLGCRTRNLLDGQQPHPFGR